MKLLLVLGIFALFTTSQAFKCVQCEYYEGDNATNSKCDSEPLADGLSSNCNQTGYDGDKWQCVKIAGKTIDEDDNEAKYVSRFCSAGTTFENTCKESDALGSKYGTVENGFLCYCPDENCNGSGQIQIGTLLTLISLIVIALRYQN